MDAVLAVDIGGTKLAAGVVDEVGELLGSHRGPTVGDRGPEALWDALVAVVEGALDAASARLGRAPAAGGGAGAGGPRLVGVGVGCGGPMGPGGELVSPLNIPAWRDFPLRARLAAWSGLPVWVDNDAKALALGEGWTGAAAGVRDFIALVVSTGVGGGIVLDGRLLHGAAGNAGHVGHVVVVPDGRRCACGGQGCLEAEASGPSIRAAFGVEPADAPLGVRARTGTLVGRGVASVANLLDLRLAVVAGSVALGFGDAFLAAAQAELDRRCRLDFSAGTRVVPARLGGSAPLVGAAAVGWAGLGAPVLPPT